MTFPMHFIAASKEFGTPDKPVPSPYFRKAFTADGKIKSAKLQICGLGFYELYCNGRRITKGALAPYISAPDDLIYYDEYDLSALITPGDNMLGVQLGNGMQNCPGGSVWDFDQARWRSALEMALKLEITFENGDCCTVESDESFKTAPSPIWFDDLRLGEYYDARREISGWATPGFDDSSWENAINAPLPRGEQVLCKADPIVETQRLKPVSITQQKDGYLYDFGANCAGVCQLTVQGTAGQEITLLHGEHLVDGILDFKNIQFDSKDYLQKDIYICKGNGEESYQPRFTYHGFQYVLVKGITPKQATGSLLTYCVMNSDLAERGGFECSDEVANTLQKLTRRSTLANFYYFPTDCPHREKNGWTGDAQISSEHTLLNLQPENSYREWLRNIRKAQTEKGSLPGIVPTGGWGYAWGNGPGWDCALISLPYFTYLYRGETEILQENATAIFRYLHYLSTQMRSDGLVAIGLGDWCQPGRKADDYKAPVAFTDSVVSMDICKKAELIFEVLGMDLQQEFAGKLYGRIRATVRERLIDFGTMTAAGNCQTSQAMAIFYDVFDNGEKPKAYEKLLAMIHAAGGHMDTGMLGARVIFHVLSAFGDSDLAFEMITRPDFPSYGNWVARGATSLWEDFQPEGGIVASHNHHFFGDISSWFIQNLAGIHLNPYKHNVNEVRIQPQFIGKLDYAKGFHVAPAGKIAVEWVRENGRITLKVDLPDGMAGNIVLPEQYIFEDGRSMKPAASGVYTILQR